MKVSILFLAVLISLSAQANECPVTKAVIISNASERIDSAGSDEPEYVNEDVIEGYLKQTFMIPPAYETIAGQLMFLSNEWPYWYGSQFNDSYSAMLAVAAEKQSLAKGNVNSSSWTASSSDYNGETPEISYEVDLTGFAEQQATLTYEVKNVGDRKVDSALAISPVKVIRTDDFVQALSGYILQGGTISGDWGASIRLSFTNKNVLGTILQVENKAGGYDAKQGAIVLPGQTVTYTFTSWGSEPYSWEIDVSTLSDAMLVEYEIESTWVDGMPVNPCIY